MPITNDSLNKDLYRLLKVRGFDPVPKDSEGETTPVPDEADVFKFTFKRHDKPYGTAWVTVDSNQQLVVYYKDEINNVGELDEDESSAGYDDSWTGFLKNLKNWAQRRQLGFDLENQDHLASDMAQRTHMKKKEQIAEGYYPMGNKASYSDAIPTIKIVLQHTRQIQEGEQRYRNVARIFLENTHGERILAPTTKPGIAQIYARHLAEGGVPNDDRWNHIKSLCEEYGKMAGFVRAVRGNQFNESAQRLVEAGLNHYQNLRESLGKMRGHRGYNAYFESWTPTLMETEGDESNLNELFVQETLDPRIESVMPILSKLKLNLGEMKEVNELAEWADNVTEQENRAALNPVGIPESDDLMEKMDPEKRKKLDDLIDAYRDSTDPSDYYDRDYKDPEEVIDMIRQEFGDKIADQVEAGADKMHFSRPGHTHGYDPMTWKKPVDRITKAGKMFKQDSDFRKNTLKSRLRNKGKVTEQGVAEEKDLQEVTVDQWDSFSRYKDIAKKHLANMEKYEHKDHEKFADAYEKHKKAIAQMKKFGASEEDVRNASKRKRDMEESVAEETEQIDETSMEKMLKYVPNAVADLSGREIKINTGKGTEKDVKKVQDRKKGLSRAAGKIGYMMAPESVAEGEIEDAEKAHNKIKTPAVFRQEKAKKTGGDWRVSWQDLEDEPKRTGTSSPGLDAIKALAGIDQKKSVGESKDKTVTIKPENEQELVDWMESEGFDLPEPTTDNKGNLVYDFTDMDHGAYIYASDFDIGSQEADDDLAEWGAGLSGNNQRMFKEKPNAPHPQIAKTEKMLQTLDPNAYSEMSVFFSEDTPNDVIQKYFQPVLGNALKINVFNYRDYDPKYVEVTDPQLFEPLLKAYIQYMKESNVHPHSMWVRVDTKPAQGVAENLDANQKRAGQLGPTGRPAEVGDLVGTNESTDPLKDMLRLLGR